MTPPPKPLFRPLFCPICGRRVRVETDGQFPEVHRLPDHEPAIGVNLCQGAVVTVTIDFDRCKDCGCNISKNASGLCCNCYGKHLESDDFKGLMDGKEMMP